MSTLPILLAFMLSFTTNNNEQPDAAPVNYLNTPVSIAFNNKNYSLVWSSHPSATYYKQEYLTKGETVEKYSSMLMLEVLTANLAPGDAVASKVAELRNMQATNPNIKYQRTAVPSSGDQILEFVITANSPDGRQIAIAEKNVYRYTQFSNAKGEKSLLLFAMSYRHYGKDAVKLLAADKNTQMIIEKVKAFTIPRITIK